jgi:hypothetical protein
MSYSIDKYNGTTIAVVEDGTIDSTLDIKLIGKNYAGYGEVQNENFVHLLENFAGSASPPRPITGQIWYDISTKKIKFYDASSARWRTAGGAESASGPTGPVGLGQGDFWWETSYTAKTKEDNSASQAAALIEINIPPLTSEENLIILVRVFLRNRRRHPTICLPPPATRSLFGTNVQFKLNRNLVHGVVGPFAVVEMYCGIRIGVLNMVRTFK